MKILVDADACPVKDEIVQCSKLFNLTLIMFVDVNHRLDKYDVQVVTVDQGSDSVDLALINAMSPGDLIVSQDYGVASLALAKRGHVIHPSGMIINEGNIDQLMFERHINREIRKNKSRGTKHKKRTMDDNIRFSEQIKRYIEQILKNDPDTM